MNQENNNNRIDLSKSLNKSAAKPQSEQRSSGPYISPESSKIIRWVIKYSGGLIRNEKQAFYFISGFMLIAFIIILLLIFGGGGGGGNEDLENFSPPAEVPTK